MTTIKALVLATSTIPTLALTLGLTLGPIVMPAPAAAVSTPSGIDPRIRLDWEAGTRRGGKRTPPQLQRGGAVADAHR